MGVVTTIVAFSAGFLVAHLSQSQTTTTLKSEPCDSSALTQHDPIYTSARLGSSDTLDDASDLENLTRFKSHFERAVALNELILGATLNLPQENLE